MRQGDQSIIRRFNEGRQGGWSVGPTRFTALVYLNSVDQRKRKRHTQRRGAMSQCLLNATLQSHQHCCECVHTERRASSFRHARSHAFSSSKGASSSGSFAGTSLRTARSHKLVKKHQPNAEAVRCQATSDKMVIAVTGRSSYVVLYHIAQEIHAQAVCN